MNKNPFATDGCDAPISLLQLAADTARSISPKPEMALVAGDLVWHGTGKEGPGGYFDPVRNKYTFVNTTYEITKHLQLPSCVALGNNDDWPDHAVMPSDDDHDYYLEQANVRWAI